jgi:hypothetical protein
LTRGAPTIIVLALALAGPADAAKPRMGWHDQRAAFHPEDSLVAYGAAQTIYARSMRLIVLWDDVQPARGEWRWDDYDRAVNAARAHGFSVHLTLGGVGRNPPRWAAGGAPIVPNGSDEAWSRIDDSAFHRFVKAAARRYAWSLRAPRQRSSEPRAWRPGEKLVGSQPQGARCARGRRTAAVRDGVRMPRGQQRRG